MVSLSSPGIGSGIDVNSLVTQLVAAEGEPASLRFNQNEARYQAEVSAFGLLKSALSEFRSTQKGLSSIAEFNSISAKSSHSDLFGAIVDSNAQSGSHSVKIESLAQAQKLASDAYSDDTSAVGSGTLTFRFGTYDSNANTFTPNVDKTEQSVTIDASNNSLRGIRDAVNNAAIGVTASIVDDGSGKRLVFSSDNSGVDNSLEITVSEDPADNDLDDIGLSQLAYDPTGSLGNGKNLSETVAAQDALLEIDGLSITRSSNTVSGVIEGVTLDLKSADIDTTATLTVSSDNSVISRKVGDFIGSFNALQSTFKNLTQVNPDTGTAGELLGDSFLRGIDNDIRRLLSNPVPGLGSGDVRTLADIGIRTESDGTLSLDSTKLNAAIDADSEGVARLFAESGKTDDSLVRYSGSYSFSVAGEYAIGVTQLATQGVFTGTSSGAFPLVIDDNNDTLSVTVDGVASSQIDLSQASYNNGSELAAEIQNKINSDANLKDAGISVQVQYDGDHFEIVSSRYGSESSVEIVSVDTNTAATLGLAAGLGVDGVDIEGTIGGLEATGSGQTLTGLGDAQGIAVEIIGGELGDRGSVSFANGLSSRLDDLISTVLGSNKVLDAKIDGVNDRISAIGEDRLALAKRLTSLEERLRKQFTALDVLVAQLQQTSSFLTQQLDNLPKIRIRNKD